MAVVGSIIPSSGGGTIISSILAFKLDEEHSNISQSNETPSPKENDPDVPLDWSIFRTLKTLLLYDE